MQSLKTDIRVGLVVLPEAGASTVVSLYDIFNMAHLVAPSDVRFVPYLVGESGGLVMTVSNISLETKAISEIKPPHVIIIPSLLLPEDHWPLGKHQTLIDWLRASYEAGSILCSACTGVFPLLETGLFDDEVVTCHWIYASSLRRTYPKIKLCIDKTLVVTGQNQNLIMSGASGSWQDLVLYLIERFSGPATANAVAKFFLLTRHPDGQAAYITFTEDTSHGDAEIARIQAWLSDRWREMESVEQLAQVAQMSERTFKRRFKLATGYTPKDYLQHLRVENAKQFLETSAMPVDEIAAAVGYQEPAFFRALFKRITGLTPSAYRAKFRSSSLEVAS